jgi:hypothetical protein
MKKSSRVATGWTALCWLNSLTLAEVISDSLLDASEAAENADDVTCIKGLSDKDIDRAIDSIVPNLKMKLKYAVAELRAERCEVDAVKLNQKFAADGECFTFNYGGMKEYHAGLEGMIGNPDPRVRLIMEEEHKTSQYATKSFMCWWRGKTTAEEEFDYVVDEETLPTDTTGMAGPGKPGNGIREAGRSGWNLDRFVSECHRLYPEAKLTVEEIIALRLYTGPMYIWYNHVLRWLHTGVPYDDGLLKKGESWSFWLNQHRQYPTHWYPDTKTPTAMMHVPFRTTIHILNSAIIKLSRTQKAGKVSV